MEYNIKYYLNTISPKGRIAWEYNPFHNLRRTKKTDKYGLHDNLVKVYGQLFTLINKERKTETNSVTNDNKEITTVNNFTINRYKDLNGLVLVIIKDFIVETTKETNSENTEEVTRETIESYLNGEPLDPKEILEYNNNDVIEAGSIVDFDTELLNFSLNNPVQIDALPSYDGSVNLILNDLRNPPRLINSRFSTKQLNTYEIVDRIGDNDTNIYDDDVNQFDIDTSLYKKYLKIPKVIFNCVESGGNLKVGNYTLYFKYCDADDNETDFVAESGIISIFKGNDKDPYSIDGGFVDMNANKTINVTLKNIDEAYDYVKVYYTRTSSDFDQNRQTIAYKLIEKFVVSKRLCNILITGDEQSELIPTSELNNEYFIADSVKTLAQCQNRLFLGNVSRPDPLHLDLTDISLRMLPFYTKYNSELKIGYVQPDTYLDNTYIPNNYEYYNTKNIYYNLGYWNEEMYRLGVVYIMYDNTLSKVYNIRGIESVPELKNNVETEYFSLPIFDDYGNRNYIKISEDDYSIIGGKYLENSRGVIRIDNDDDSDYIYSIQIQIPDEVYNYLKNYCGVKGLFFVRLKRIPTIMAQGLTIPIDPESRVPLIYHNAIKEEDSTQDEEVFAEESFLSLEKTKIRHRTLFRKAKYKSKELLHDYDKRLIYCENTDRFKNSLESAIICPDYEIRQLYYNQFFTGTEFPIKYIKYLLYIQRSDVNNRFYVTSKHDSKSNELLTSAKLVSVTEEVPTIAIKDKVFRSVCGIAQEPFRFKYAFKEGSKTKNDTNLLRGIWSPYVAALFKDKVSYGKIVNIYIPGYNISNLSNYFKVRYNDNSPYYAISDRIGIDDVSSLPFNSNLGYSMEVFRGDCYLCTFTHRLNRNFCDPTSPANDEIVDKDSWEKFDPEDETTFEKVNLGDINAIKMGSWYTFKLRSNTNLSIRSLDESRLEEKGLFGLPRGFYPLSQELENGDNKIPDSYNVNDGFRSNFGEKLYMRYPDVPYIKNNYENRILYSDIAVNDAFRNGYRVFKSTNFNDYTKEYGSIVKLLTMSQQGLQTGLLCVFEHGVAYIPVQERTVSGQGAGGDVFINTTTILPDNPRVISDKIGSQWEESVIQTPYYVYGVDTVAKKIWRTNGSQLEIISDHTVNKFLIDNISLSEKELTPIIGVRNVKSHYNANKNDVMFTFYDNLYGIEEKAWNLCFNELMGKFVTLYSWIPAYSENIDNTYFSFDRDISKSIAKLGTSKVGSTNADGIVLSNSVIDYEDYDDSDVVEINENSEVLIPSYHNSKDTLTLDLADNIELNAQGETQGGNPPWLYIIDNEYLKLNNSNQERKYKLTGDGLKLRPDFWDTVIKHYIDANYACLPWNLSDTMSYRKMFTTRIQTDIVGLENRILPSGEDLTITYNYEILKDPYGNWRNFLLADEYDENNTKHTVLKFWPPIDMREFPLGVTVPSDELAAFDGYPYLLFRNRNTNEHTFLKNDGTNIRLAQESLTNGGFPRSIVTRKDSGDVPTEPFKITLNLGRPINITESVPGLQKLEYYKTYYTNNYIDLIRSNIGTYCYLNYGYTGGTIQLLIEFVDNKYITSTGNDKNIFYVLRILLQLDPNNPNDKINKWISDCERYYQNRSDFFIKYNKNKIDLFNSKKVWYVYLKCNINVTSTSVNDYKAAYANSWSDDKLRYNYGYYTSVIAVTSQKVFDNYIKYDLNSDGHQERAEENVEVLSSDFWKHGQSGIIDIKDEIEPCRWYGTPHPFEFEFVVRETPNAHKIFDNLEIISNKAEPESFHFEVVGEDYEFANDKKNMYIRQELTKKMWQGLGIEMTYNHDVNKLKGEKNIKSTIFPLYYNRIDTYNELYDIYTKMNGESRDYRNLSGSEIVWDKLLNEFKILTHMKNTPITKAWNEVSYNEYCRFPDEYKRIGENGKYYVWKETGRIRGNSHYKEDRWKILIPSITFMLKNEKLWAIDNGVEIPPVVINYIPDEYPCTFISKDYIPNIYNMGLTKIQKSNGNYLLEEAYPDNYNVENEFELQERKEKWEIDGTSKDNYWIDVTPWTYRKETKIRDKYLKVRIRYEGSLLAIIQAVLTTYTESYA